METKKIEEEAKKKRAEIRKVKALERQKAADIRKEKTAARRREETAKKAAKLESRKDRNASKKTTTASGNENNRAASPGSSADNGTSPLSEISVDALRNIIISPVESVNAHNPDGLGLLFKAANALSAFAALTQVWTLKSRRTCRQFRTRA